MSIMERLGRASGATSTGSGSKFGPRVKGTFHVYKEKANKIRLVGDFLETRSHFIVPSERSRGICVPEAFVGEKPLPKVINCLDWDINTERPTPIKTCPVCKINRIARAILGEKPRKGEEALFLAVRKTIPEKPQGDELALFKAFVMASKPTKAFKWNGLDRDDPNVTVVKDDNSEEKVLAYKIISVGPEAARDIFGICQQVGYDIADIDRGVDIEIVKDSSSGRVTYSARAIISGTTLMVTPLTERERALPLHDLKVRCGRSTDASAILSKMQDDYKSLLDLEDNTAPTSVESQIEEIVESENTVVKSSESKTDKKSMVALPEDDEDSLLGSQKKT